MVRSQHRFVAVVLVVLFAVVVAGCGDDGSSEPNSKRTPPKPEALRPAALTKVADFAVGGTSPISTELEEVAPDTWLLTYGTQTKANDLDGSLALSTDDGATWKQLDTGATFATKGPDAFNSAASIDDTWVVAGVYGPSTPADDPYLPAAWWSQDEGATWTRVILPVLPNHNAIVNDLVRWKGALYAVGQFQPDGGKRPRTGAIWRSEDGRTWKIVGSGELFSGGSKEVYLLSVAANDDGLLVAGTVSRDGDSFAGRDAMPVLWTSRDGATWGGRTDLERPGARVSDLEIGGTDGDQFVLSGSSGSEEDSAAWFEVGTLSVNGDELSVDISTEQAMRSTKPATFARGLTPRGIVRGVAWHGDAWVAAEVGTVGGEQPLTLWRSSDAGTFTPLGPKDTQPTFIPNQLDALGDLELRDRLLLTTGRPTGTTRVVVYRATGS